MVGMEPGPDGAGGDLLRELIHLATAPERVVRHEWQAGDAVLYDNRVLMHSATWFDAELARREMWRLTIHTPAGPGPGFDTSELPSWEINRWGDQGQQGGTVAAAAEGPPDAADAAPEPAGRAVVLLLPSATVRGHSCGGCT